MQTKRSAGLLRLFLRTQPIHCRHRQASSFRRPLKPIHHQIAAKAKAFLNATKRAALKAFIIAKRNGVMASVKIRNIHNKIVMVLCRYGCVVVSMGK